MPYFRDPQNISVLYDCYNIGEISKREKNWGRRKKKTLPMKLHHKIIN